MNAAPDIKTLTVCLVDDDPSVLRATSRLLYSAGWKVESFADPIAFLHYAQTHRPQVVVLDILMPIMNGLEVQTRLRHVSPSTRVVARANRRFEGLFERNATSRKLVPDPTFMGDSNRSSGMGLRALR